jgi:protein-L-isoaspartate(D-aspartate) O-methyltransferase
MESNDALVDYLKRIGVLLDEDVERAMRAVDRAAFVEPQYRSAAYADTPLPTSSGQTISAPHMVAVMTQHLTAGLGMRVLEVGAGSGYQAAVLSELVGDEGAVVTMERVPELAALSKKRLAGYENVTVVAGNGALGYPKKAPYDRVLVSCAAREPPQALLAQLGGSGRMVVPIGPRGSQKLMLIEKVAGRVTAQDLGCDCVFVPLV